MTQETTTQSESSGESLPPEDELTTEEMLSHFEFGLWTAVALIPILYYVNGPSVSRDQFVTRSIIVAIAYLGAPTLRFYRWRRNRQEQTSSSTEQS